MKSADILINTILSLIVGIAATIIRIRFSLDLNIVIVIAFLIISLFWINTSIIEVKQRSIDNSRKIKEDKRDIKYVEKDLNMINVYLR